MVVKQLDNHMQKNTWISIKSLHYTQKWTHNRSETQMCNLKL